MSRRRRHHSYYICLFSRVRPIVLGLLWYFPDNEGDDLTTGLCDVVKCRESSACECGLQSSRTPAVDKDKKPRLGRAVVVDTNERRRCEHFIVDDKFVMSFYFVHDDAWICVL